MRTCESSFRKKVAESQALCSALLLCHCRNDQRVSHCGRVLRQWLYSASAAGPAVRLAAEAVSDTVSMENTFYALEDFAVSELVLVRNVNRKEPWWPVCLQH